MPDRSAFCPPRNRAADRRGVTLIEVMIALSILSVVLVSLAGLMYQMGRHTRRSAGVASRTAAVQSALSTVQTVPWDSLPNFVGCVADSAGSLTFTRCIQVGSISTRLRNIRVIVVPDDPLLRPDTIVVRRSRPRSKSPLYTS